MGKKKRSASKHHAHSHTHKDGQERDLQTIKDINECLQNKVGCSAAKTTTAVRGGHLRPAAASPRCSRAPLACFAGPAPAKEAILRSRACQSQPQRALLGPAARGRDWLLHRRGVRDVGCSPAQRQTRCQS